MPLTPELAPAVLAACQENAGEASAAFTRAFGAPLEIGAPLEGGFSLAAPPAEWSGPGLAMALLVEGQAVLVLLPEAGGLLPAWYRAPDITGASKLATLAQEWGMTLLPESAMPDDFQAGPVESLQAAVERGGVPPTATVVAWPLVGGDNRATLWLVWPAPRGREALGAKSAPTAPPAPKRPAPIPDTPEAFEAALASLPGYVRSLLNIRVEVAVRLAATRQPLAKILNLGPGSILQFNQSCERPLSICVGDHEIASGEAVKVGDRFGVRVTAITLPGERFFPLAGRGGIRKSWAKGAS